MTAISYTLPQGELSLSLRAGVNGAQAQDYFSVVARDNPRRAFLFLSKLLGKHVPVSPTVMRETYHKLATQLQQLHLSDSYLFVGMAETATALSQGVYDAWLEDVQEGTSLPPSSLPPSSVFVSTTRYYFADKQRIEFEEAHSHAPAIGLYVPDDKKLKSHFMSAKTLVVIDDELSTGKTVVALVKALLSQGLPLERVITVVLTDFSQAHDAEMRQALSPIALERVSLLQGQWQFKANPKANNAPHVTNSDLNSDLAKAQTDKKILLPANAPSKGNQMARLGTQTVSVLSEAVKQQCQKFLGNSQRILVLGCGEYMYPPYLLAHYLTTLGVDAYFCATTRSPIKVWGDIRHRHCWSDPYGEGVNNYLYNYHREKYDDVWLISELPSNNVLRDTAKQLQARLLCFTQEDTLEDGFID